MVLGQDLVTEDQAAGADVRTAAGDQPPSSAPGVLPTEVAPEVRVGGRETSPLVRLGGTGLEHPASKRDTAVADPGLPGPRDELARLELVHAAERAGRRDRAPAQPFFFHARHGNAWVRVEAGQGVGLEAKRLSLSGMG